MFKARTYKADGKKGRAQSLPDSIFDGVVNEGVMHQVVKAYLSNQRQGTGAAKTRSDVRGGARKPWRQKGTGRARAGTTRAAQWVGGGVAFPPIPHSWRKQVPKKVRSLARRSALNDRAEHDRVVLAELPTMEKPRTQELLGFIGAMGLEGKTLILTSGKNENVYLSARNLSKVQVLAFGNESVYDVLWANTVVIEKGAFAASEAAATRAEEAAEVAVEETPEAEEADAPEVDAQEADAPEAAAAAPEAEAAADAPEAEAAADAPEAEAEAPAPEDDETEEKADA
jgi:large subunit ribosomal protein L4